MLKNISQGFSKFFTNERIIILVIFLILAWGLLAYSGAKNLRVDAMTTNYATTAGAQEDFEPYEEHFDSDEVASHSAPITQTSTILSRPSAQQEGLHNDTSNVANPSDLLPSDQNSQWAALNPTTMKQGDVLMPDLLQAGYHIGLDTIGQTLRNANLQLRSDPVIPKTLVGPWNQSTIEPDLGRVPLELGQGCQ
jgi:hypothetical protein